MGKRMMMRKRMVGVERLERKGRSRKALTRMKKKEGEEEKGGMERRIGIEDEKCSKPNKPRPSTFPAPPPNQHKFFEAKNLFFGIGTINQGIISG